MVEADAARAHDGPFGQPRDEDRKDDNGHGVGTDADRHTNRVQGPPREAVAHKGQKPHRARAADEVAQPRPIRGLEVDFAQAFHVGHLRACAEDPAPVVVRAKGVAHVEREGHGDDEGHQRREEDVEAQIAAVAADGAGHFGAVGRGDHEKALELVVPAVGQPQGDVALRGGVRPERVPDEGLADKRGTAEEQAALHDDARNADVEDQGRQDKERDGGQVHAGSPHPKGDVEQGQPAAKDDHPIGHQLVCVVNVRIVVHCFAPDRAEVPTRHPQHAGDEGD